MFLMTLVDLIPPSLHKYLLTPGLRHPVPTFQVKVLPTMLVNLSHGNSVPTTTKSFYIH